MNNTNSLNMLPSLINEGGGTPMGIYVYTCTASQVNGEITEQAILIAFWDLSEDDVRKNKHGLIEGKSCLSKPLVFYVEITTVDL